MNVLAEETMRELPMAPMWFGIIALVVFAAALALTYSFRNIAHRHAHLDGKAAGHGATGRHGAGSH